MTRVLITGGTGVLGREMRARLLKAEYTVRIMSRRIPRPGEDANIEWAQAHLETGEGLAEALRGADVVIHAASGPTRSKQVDGEGTIRLLEQVKAAGVGHFLYISIVGIDRIPYAYYQQKLAAEFSIEAGGIPYTILRATQFHTLLDYALSRVMRYPIVFLPIDFRFQLIDAGEVADRMLEIVRAGPLGRLPDIGGPKVQTLGELISPWLAARKLKRLVLPLPIPGKVAAGFRAGLNTISNNPVGLVTWEEWLGHKYPDRTSLTEKESSV